MLIAIVVLWILCGYLCCKIESILTHQETFNVRIWFALIFWPAVIFDILFTQHHVGLVKLDGTYVTNDWRL